MARMTNSRKSVLKSAHHQTLPTETFSGLLDELAAIETTMAGASVVLGETEDLDTVKATADGGVSTKAARADHVHTIASTSIVDAKIAAGVITEAKLQVGAAGAGLTGLVAKFAADANVIGALPVVHRVAVASGANGNTTVTLTHKTRVIDCWFVMKGAGTAGCTLQLKNVSTAITEAYDASALGDKAMSRWATIDDAQHEIAAGANMVVAKASTGGDFPGAEVYVLGLRVA